jgi:hypothetical protein
MEINKNTIEVLKAWSEISKKRLQRNLYTLDANETKDLLNSIDFHVVDREITLQYNYYGMYVDMGVGKGVPLAKARSGGSTRKPKLWYTKTIWREVAILGDIIAKDFGVMLFTSVLVEGKTTDRIDFDLG